MELACQSRENQTGYDILGDHIKRHLYQNEQATCLLRLSARETNKTKTLQIIMGLFNFIRSLFKRRKHSSFRGTDASSTTGLSERTGTRKSLRASVKRKSNFNINVEGFDLDD